MDVQASPGGPSTLLGAFKHRLSSIQNHGRTSPTAPLPPEEEQEHMLLPSASASPAAAASASPQEQQQQDEEEPQSQEENAEPAVLSEAQVMEELVRAREAFMCQRWGAILKQAKAGKPLAALAAEQQARTQQQQQQDDGHLQGLFHAAEGDVRGLVQGFLQEHARQGQAHETLLQKKAEVEALLGTLEEAQARLALEEEAVAGQQAEMDEEEEEAAEVEGQAQVRRLEEAVEAAEAEGRAAEERVKQLQGNLAALQATAEEEKAAMVAADMTNVKASDEAAAVAEAARLREHAECLAMLLQTLQGLYGVTVTVLDEAEVGAGEMIMRLAYPSKHALELTLATTGGKVSLLHARLEMPPTQQRRKSVATTEAHRLMMNQVENFVTVAQGLAPPQDLLFLAREVGWMVSSRGVAKQEIRELMKRYIVKHNEAMDELTVTFAEGVVASFSLLSGYPQMPGSVRIAGLVGVGGWKDAELAVTSRSLNGLGLDSLTALVDALHERIVELDKAA